MPELREITPRGPFSLRAAAEFGFGPTAGRAPAFEGSMRLAFAVDGGIGYAGAVLRQRRDDQPVEVQLEVREAGVDIAMGQLARILSLDHDGEQFMAVGARDPVIAGLQRKHPGQRPVLFHSPYEAAAWSIISARRPAGAAALVRQGLAERLGARFELTGRTVHAFPQPERLLELEDDPPGLGREKATRLRGVAQAAAEGLLDVEHLHELGPEKAFAEVQRVRGIGPFYAGLVVLRAGGFADAPLLVAEPRVLAHAARMYGEPEPVSIEWFTEISAPWRPFRTWATVLIRLGGDRDG